MLQKEALIRLLRAQKKPLKGLGDLIFTINDAAV